MGHPNEDLLRTVYAAFANEDIGVIMKAFSPDVVWHESGKHSLSGDYEGIQEVLGLLGQMAEKLGGMKAELHDVVANDDHAIGLEEMTIGSGSNAFVTKAVAIFHVKNGRISEGWEFRENQAAIDELLSP